MAQFRKSQYHFPIDVIRLCSALSVCWAHLSVYSWASSYSSTAQALEGATRLPWAVPSAWAVWIALEVLFVISGFLIAQSAMGATAMRFIKSRVLRLFPAIWICATLTLIARLAFGPDTPRALASPYLHSLVLWPVGPWIDGVYWSLTVELAFYGLIVALLAARGFHRLSVLAFCLAGVSAIFLGLDFSGLGKAMGGSAWAFIFANADPLLLRYGVFFSIGIWLWQLSERQMTPARWGGLLVASLFAGVEIWMRAVRLQTEEAPITAGQPMWLPIVVWVVAVVALALFTRWPARFTPKSDKVKRRLRQVGLVTYPLYLLHNVIGASLIRALVHRGVDSVVALVCAILFSLALATAVALLAEPAIRSVIAGLGHIGLLRPSRPRGPALGLVPGGD